MFYIFVMSVLAFPSIIEANHAAHYKIHSPKNGVDPLQCGRLALGFDFCGARVNSDVCEPLTTDWCETKTMSPGDIYLVKDMFVEKLQDPAVFDYVRQLPICMDIGSEIELKFMLHTGWVWGDLNLVDEPGNIVLHTKMFNDNKTLVTTYLDGIWGEFIWFNHALVVDVEYALKVVCDTTAFEMYIDGVHEWTFPYRLPELPVHAVRSIAHFREGTDFDFLQITYQA